MNVLRFFLRKEFIINRFYSCTYENYEKFGKTPKYQHVTTYES